MAETPPPLQAFVFDFVTSSYKPYAPLRSMQQAGFRTGSFNGIMHDGQFRKRGGITVDTNTLTINANGAFSEKYNGQSPVDILNLVIDPFSASAELPVIVMLTTSECWVIQASGTTNLTPTYGTGTISINNGTTSLTGVGTAWVTEGIVAGQLVNLPNGSANWYSIASVGSDTTITLKQTYTGANLAAQAYTIRRTGRSSSNPLTSAAGNGFARLFNGDLYYTYCEGEVNFCVVRVTDILGSIGTPEIIGAAYFDNLSGCDIWTNGAVTEIKGLELLTDGRVVIATSETTGTSDIQSRIRYSSHLSQTVWNTAPGGFSDVVNLPGKMNAMREYGAYLACHYDNGIVLAVPTGQDDPPLNFQRVQTVRTGCINSRALANTPMGQIYLGGDGNVYAFDGSGQTPITDATRTTVSALSAKAYHACYESTRNTWWLFDTAASTGTVFYAIDVETGLVSYHKSSTFIMAATDVGGPSTTRLYLGLPSYDPAAAGTAGATSTMLYDLDMADAADVVPAFTGVSTVASLSVVTDWIDFGMLGIDKTFDHAVIFYESTGSYTMRLTAKRDGLSTDPVSFATTNTSAEEKFAKLFFAPKTSEKWQFTLDTATVNTSSWDVRPQRMILYFTPKANVEPVPR